MTNTISGQTDSLVTSVDSAPGPAHSLVIGPVNLKSKDKSF